MISKFEIKVNKDKKNRLIKSITLNYLNRLELEKHLDEIKEKVLDDVESYIDAHRKRPSVKGFSNSSKKHLINVLRKTSFVEKFRDYTYRLAIGNVNVLDKEVPYWYVLNYGGIPWGGKIFYGVFEDGAPRRGGKGNAWLDGRIDDKGNMHMMKPKNPIAPMHYLNYMSHRFILEIKKFKSKIKSRRKSK